MFDLKHNRLPPGSLIRFCQDFWLIGKIPWDVIPRGAYALVIEHSKPVYVKVVLSEEVEDLDFRDLVLLNGYVPHFELIKLPVGKQLEKWW